MKRGIAVAIVCVVALAGGCAGPARYVDKKADSGVVAIPSNTDMWPFHYRQEALTLIQQHVGPYYEIVEERQVVTGQQTRNEQTTTTDQLANKKNPNQTGERQTTSGSVLTQNTTEWQITYRRLPGPIGLNQPAGGVPGGPTGVQPAGGLPPGTIPSVAPPGTPPRGTPGAPISYFTPPTRQADANGCSS
jgi:hypothetical protein